MNICTAIQQLIDYSVNNNLITKDDELVVRNMLMDALRVSDWEEDAIMGRIRLVNRDMT